jgi:hypothetical protein
VPESERSGDGSTLDQPDDENHDRDHQENVDEAAHGVARNQTQEPENQQDDEYGPEHGVVSSYKFEPPKAAHGWLQRRSCQIRARNRELGTLTPSLKNPADLVARLELVEPEKVLLIDSPAELTSLVEKARGAPRSTTTGSSDALRMVKETFDAILVWREDRGGSRSVLDGASKRLEAGGAIWVVTALRKVRGPTTPAVHRIELSDLVKGFAKEGLLHDREVRVSAWNVAYRFRRPEGKNPKRKT